MSFKSWLKEDWYKGDEKKRLNGRLIVDFIGIIIGLAFSFIIIGIPLLIIAIVDLILTMKNLNDLYRSTNLKKFVKKKKR